ncbi:hypothetical protein [Nocardia carnea]|uniref:Uncharacterized protein n=1 Tax=Nocardia carnea TaxID=37328 RepID=A0ABW7TH51_9NOCA|nr:hypothetical protein [Nocardia carnea]
MISGTADRLGGIAQAVRHGLLAGQQLIGIGGEVFRERVAHIVVTPAPVGEIQRIAQVGAGAADALAEFRQPGRLPQQFIWIQLDFAGHTATRPSPPGRPAAADSWVRAGPAPRRR